ncbi:MAG: CNNM domain-containing protein [Candidatus Omnitrophica bacterium]|jgi:CBS domain containing-hemolysin-like protein|nr:CNNM domain-containing protein [Candidatus Omnitrophota bacterium]
MLSFFVIIGLAIGISFVCSVVEACLLSLSLADIARISDKKPMAAKIWKGFKEKVQGPIAVILIINTLSHTIGASLFGAKFSQLFGPKWIMLYSLVFSFAMIQWSEILPKTLGVRYNTKIAVMTALPLRYLIYAFTPLVRMVQWLNRPFESPAVKGARMNATEDISVLARFAAFNNMISKDQERILSQTLRLSGMKVKDVVISKEEIKYLSTDMTLTQALIEAHVHHHTRLPLINGNDINNVIGYINFKDIVSALQFNPKDPSIKSIVRPVMEIGDDEPISVLLNRLIKGYQHIAIVRNRKNEVAGLVTLEDVMELIMGDMQDEYDVLPAYFYQIAGNRFLAGGGLKLRMLKESTGLDVPDMDITVNEWLLELFGSMPKVEDRLKYKDSTFITRKICRSRVHEVIVETGAKQAE